MADYQFEIHPKAVWELADAYQWYERQDHHAAKRFETAIDQATVRIMRAPDSFALYLGSTRRVPVKRYPYSIVYTLDEIGILFVAFSHTSREEG
ncbi:type II toxin-antitoxin system RelE/ParE family toxin [Lacunimicrobium album]